MTNQISQKVEIPYIKGESKLVYPPAPDSSNELWHINDHCFITDSKGILHFFGINNPYPADRNDRATLYRDHPYLGHATSVAPESTWQRQDFALDDEYLGAPFVVWMTDQKRYIMLFESRINKHRVLELAYSSDLFHWQRTNTPVLEKLHECKRDPAILKQDDGSFLIYLCTPHPEGSSVSVTKTFDFESFESTQTCLLIKDGISYSGIESPFVVKRNGLYYLFFTYAHRHYYETIVCVSDKYDEFSMNNIVTTIFGHASEIFDYEGKTYISSCGPEDDQVLNRHGLYLSELKWLIPS